MADTQPERCQQAPERVDKRNKVAPPDDEVGIYDQPNQEILAKGPDPTFMRPVSEDCLFLK